MDNIKVSSKGQITLPSRVREKLDISYGDNLMVKVEKNKIILEVPEYKDFESFAESIPKSTKFVSKEDIKKIRQERSVKRYERSLH